MSLKKWQWAVRVAEGGMLESKAPPTDIAFLLLCTRGLAATGDSFTLTWRDAKGEFHQAEKFVSDEYRHNASRPQILWSNKVHPDLSVQISLDHPETQRGESIRSGAVYRVAYRYKGELIPVDPAD